MKRILVISPHADDMELGCGGYVRKCILAGAEVKNVVVATGNIIHPRIQREVTKEERHAELVKSLAVLGVQDWFVLFPGYDTLLDSFPLVDLVREIEKQVTSFKPTEIFIPLPSAHQDHNRTYDACLAALRPSVMEKSIELIAAYEYPASGWGDCTFLDGGKSGMYVNILDTIDKKLEALRCYKSQIVNEKHCFSTEAATVMAKMRGIECGMEYAEMFRVMRKVIR